jgi:hypothetical protein
VHRNTLYTLTPKGAGCNAACQKYWLAVLLPKGVQKATAVAGINASTLGTPLLSVGVE